MERYKKRTIALCLASVLTVVGAFGAENYNNTLMALKVDVGSGGFVKLTAYTKNPYNTPIKTSKIDDNTFVVTLQDTDNNASAPNIENYENIKSIQISTYPYTTEADGCTRVVVKTAGEPALIASSALFIPDNIQQNNTDLSTNNMDSQTEEIYDDNEDIDNEQNSEVDTYSDDSTSEENTEHPSEDISKAFTPPDYSNTEPSNSHESRIVILCISILLVLIGFIFMLSRDKMSTVVGDQGNFDVDDNKKNKKQSKTKKLRSAINQLDTAYTNKTNASEYTYNRTDEYTEETDSNKNELEEEEPQSVVVDLDTLYMESQKNSDITENNNEDDDDLADLLNSFTAEAESEEDNEEPEENLFDKELYNKIINNDSLKFSDSDLQKINQLLQIEISPETLDNLEKYVKTPPVKPPTQEQILEDILTTYSIQRNIDFTKEDVDAIRKLMNVELGPDFVKDFATNPARTKVVEKEIKENALKKIHRASEIMTLNVKSLLPDLSEELKKQGNKAIKSEVKPTVVYYSEGYEYDKLNVPNELSSLPSSININDEQNNYKPSYQEPIVASGYEVSTLSISNNLPDLSDVIANPQKYKEQVNNKAKVDEKALLKSIANVKFKPFYEETETELNDFEDLEFFVKDKKLNEQSGHETRNNDNAQKLLKLIEEQQNERAIKKQAAENETFKKELESFIKKEKSPQLKSENQINEEYKYNGKIYKIIKTVKCTPNSECKLLKTNNKYIITGNINEKEIILKEYDNLKNAEMHIRLNDKSDKTKFLVKIDTHKFIINVTTDNMEFIMDLC